MKFLLYVLGACVCRWSGLIDFKEKPVTSILVYVVGCGIILLYGYLCAKDGRNL
jgi:hypothetical protein